MLDDISCVEVDGVLECLLRGAEAASGVIDDGLFLSLPVGRSGRVGAVDGGSAVLFDLGALVVGVFRSGFLVYDCGVRVAENVSPLRVVALEKASVGSVYSDACTGFPAHNPPEKLVAVLDRLRFLGEMKCALGVLDHLGEGDTLVLDGSLRVDISHPGDVLSFVVDRALERGVGVVGVSKSSSLHIGGLPVLSLAQHRARHLGLGAWLYPLEGDSHNMGDVFAACFHPGSRFSFRVDVAGSIENIGRVACYCGDASLLGYPSILASVHNSVAVSRSTVHSLGLMLESRLATMPGARGWPELLTDFHSILDLGV